ncbi:MAG: hypothetical protein WC449_06270 [Candidatus Paceibacterota bacterium]
MATYNLINTIAYGNAGTLKSGSLVNTVSENIVQIAAAGGILVPTGLSATLDAAAAAVQQLWKDGKSQEACDAAMMGAYGVYLAAYEVAHDYVDNETATNQNEGAHTHATGNEGAHTHAIALGGVGIAATNTSSPASSQVPKQDFYPALVAPGANYVAQYAAGAAIDDAVGPFVVPGYPFRTARIVLGATIVPAVIYTIDGTDAFGNIVQDIINAAGAGTYEGDVAFETITRFRSNIDPGGTTDLRVGNGFCLSSPIDAAITRLVVGVTPEAAVAVGLTSGTVVPTTVPNGALNFLVRYPTLPTSVYSQQDFYPALVAPGTNYVGQYAAGAPLDDAVGPFVIPGYPFRTARIVLGVGGADPVVYTVDGTDAFGNVVQDIITATGAGTYEGDIAFATITRFRSDVNPGGTTDLRVGNGFNVSDPINTAVSRLAVNAVLEAPAATGLASGTVVPTTPPNAARNFTVRFPTTRTLAAHTHTLTDPTHAHGAVTGAGSNHNHGNTGAGSNHTHTQNAHNHTLS